LGALRNLRRIRQLGARAVDEDRRVNRSVEGAADGVVA
jgi:hypothetical protein